MIGYDKLNDANDGLQDRAYSTLSGFFFEHRNEVIEIVILPPAIPPPDGISMQEGLNIGVSKTALALAFIRAKELFFSGIKEDGNTSEDAQDASRVMLLFDPENITVANFRKRRLLELQRDRIYENFTWELHQEIVLLDSILTSPLHRQSKSPTLWYHRAWLLDLLFPVKLAAGHVECIELIQDELKAVMKAAERHPKNYYAWQYARRLLAKVDDIHANSPDRPWSLSSLSSIMGLTLRRVKTWCFQNPSDISGWSFLLFVVKRVESVITRTTIVNEVIEYAIKFELKQESLWVFLRTILADTVLQDERVGIIQNLHDYPRERHEVKSGTGAAETTESRAMQAIKWIELYEAPVS